MSGLATGVIAWVAFSMGAGFGSWIAWHFASKHLGWLITEHLPRSMRALADELEASPVHFDGNEHKDGKRVQ